jgi:hypothetical protein
MACDVATEKWFLLVFRPSTIAKIDRPLDQHNSRQDVLLVIMPVERRINVRSVGGPRALTADEGINGYHAE